MCRSDGGSVTFEKSQTLLKIQEERTPHLEKGEVCLIADDGITAGRELEIDIIPCPAFIGPTGLRRFTLESHSVF